MSRRPSFSARIRAAFLALGLIAIILTGALALNASSEALRKASYAHLTSIRDTKKRQVESYLAEAGALVGALARSQIAIDSLQGVEDASLDDAAVRRTHEKELMAVAAALGFEDVLLIRAADGRILYASGERVGSTIGELGETELSRVFKAVMKDGAATRIADYSVYPDGSGVGAFATAAVVDGEQRIGLVAARLSIPKINEIMTGGGRWREEGLGESGETYLVGSDRLMRSDSRFLIEAPAEYYSQLRALGGSTGQVEQIRKQRTTVLLQPVNTEAASQALAGQAGVGESRDYRGVPVLSAFAPLDVPELGWVLLSELDVEEAFAPVAALRQQIFLLGLAVSAAFLGLGYVFSKRTTKPLLALTDAVERLGQEDWRDVGQLASFEATDDEVARLAQQFDKVSGRLRETSVSRDYLDDLLESMLNAVFTIGPIGAYGDDRPQVRTRSANPAAADLLGYRESDLRALPIRRLFDHDEDLKWLDDLRRDGHIPAAEKLFKTKDGRSIPVLFTAAKVRSRRNDGGVDAVCVAQDITDRKAAEIRLQALNQRLLTAQEEERGRLARELHDDVTQRLGALAIDAGNLTRCDGCPDGMRQSLDAMKENTIRLSEDVQGLSRRLHPSILDDLGLVAALRSETQALQDRLNITSSFAAEDPPPDFPKSSSLALYRISQEAFHNIARHAQATEVNVELVVAGGTVRLRIEDDGIGFDATQLQPGGLGIASLAERARLAGGRLIIRSAPYEGVRIIAEIPASAPEQEVLLT